MSLDLLVVGVDAGSSTLRAVWTDLDGKVVASARHEVGGNAALEGVDVVQRRVMALLGEGEARRRGRVLAACVGAAGMDTPSDVALQVEAWGGAFRAVMGERFEGPVHTSLSELARPLNLLSDVDLLQDLEEGVCVGLIAGTGSNATGLRVEGGKVVARHACGGIDRPLSDEGSAAWLGEAAMRAAVQHGDRRRRSELGAAVLAHVGVAEQDWKRCKDLVSAWSKRELAQLAGRVVAPRAKAGDPEAVALLQQAGSDLGLMAATCARELGAGRDWRLGFTGAVILEGPGVHLAMSRSIERAGLALPLFREVPRPEVRAAALAARAAGAR